MNRKDLNMEVLIRKTILISAIFAITSSCTTLPKVVHEKHKFPRFAYVGEPGRPYKKLGLVKTKVLFPTLDVDSDERVLCKVYYNKAVKDLLKRAQAVKADAVIDVHSAVFMIDGRSEVFKTPECTDDGQEGQVLVEGIAIRWKSEKEMSSDEKIQYAEWKKSPKWSQPPDNSLLLETTASNAKAGRRTEEPAPLASPSAIPVATEVNPNAGSFSGYTDESSDALKIAPTVPVPAAVATAPIEGKIEAAAPSPAFVPQPEEEAPAPVKKSRRRQTAVRPNGPLLR